MLEKELNEFIKASKESLDKMEKKVDSLKESMSDDIGSLWGKLKEEFSQISEKLSNAGDQLQDEAKLQGKLGIMEARDHLESIKETSEEFIQKVTNNAAQELDAAKLQAHLAKMDAADLWKEKESDLTKLYNDSKDEFEKRVKNAGKEISDILVKLTDIR